jgi:hypothetical protein
MINHRMHEKLEVKVESLLGTGDLRMIYGVGVPFFAMTLLIIGALVLEAVWLSAVLMLLIAVSTAIVLVGINHMLDDEDGTGLTR